MNIYSTLGQTSFAKLLTIALISALAGLMACESAMAQGRGGGGERDRGRGERDRGDRDRRDGDRRDRDRGRDRGGDDNGDRDRRRREWWLRRMDSNRDGVISKDEIPDGGAGRFFRGVVENSGLSERDSYKVDDLLLNAEQRKARDLTNATSFGVKDDSKPTPGFDEPLKTTSLTAGIVQATAEEIDKASKSADDILKKYDKNGNKQLEREEWKEIGASAVNADANRDANITRVELINRKIVLNRRYALEDRIKGATSNDKPKAGSGGGDDMRGGSRRSRPSGRGESRSSGNRLGKSGRSSSDRNSYRFVTPEEQIPEAARGWIKSRDKNGDGQVAMHEYTTSWSDRRVREFRKYDSSGDGVITPEEYLANK